MKILITAGPTNEYIDDVRFISNESSGKMGIALVNSARKKKHNVILVSGPISLKIPEGIFVETVTSAMEMRDSVNKYFDKVDAVIMAAAVSDYRPEKKVSGKLKKTKEGITLKLLPNPDILSELGKKKSNKTLIGFALEQKPSVESAYEKLKSKNLDFIILNTEESLGSDRADFWIIDRNSSVKEMKNTSKAKLSTKIIKLIEDMRAR